MLGFNCLKNIFNSDDGYIKLHLRADAESKQDTYEWSETVKDERNNQLLIDASRTKGFLDYKDLLETHYLHRENDVVNVFDLLVKTLLANTVSRQTDRSLTENWESIQHPSEETQLDSQDFWDPVKVENGKSGFLDVSLIRDIELYRTRILNPLSHTTITNIPKKEIEDAIEAVVRLETALR